MSSPFSVDVTRFQEWLSLNEQPDWVIDAVTKCIERIKQLPHPKQEGGRRPSGKRWFYLVGKFQLMCVIDESQRVVFVERLIKLP